LAYCRWIGNSVCRWSDFHIVARQLTDQDEVYGAVEYGYFGITRAAVEETTASFDRSMPEQERLTLDFSY